MNEKKRIDSIFSHKAAQPLKAVVLSTIFSLVGGIFFFLIAFYTYVGFWTIADQYLMSLPLYIIFTISFAGAFIVLHSLNAGIFSRLSYQMATGIKKPFMLFFIIHLIWTTPWILLLILGAIIATEQFYPILLSFYFIAYVFSTFILRSSIHHDWKTTKQNMKMLLSKLKHMIFPFIFGLFILWFTLFLTGKLFDISPYLFFGIFIPTIFVYISWMRLQCYTALAKQQ